MKYFLKHGHLIIDRNKEYLDGSILIEDKKILDVFVNSNKEFLDAQTIDLKGKVILPNFFNSDLKKDPKLIEELFLDTGYLEPISDSKTNEAFSNKYYVSVNIYDLNEIVTKLIINNINKDKLILIEGKKGYSLDLQIKKLRKMNVSFSDILAYTSKNAYEYSSLDWYYGSLRKGKSADILLLDEKGNILNRYIDGKFYD